MIGHLLTDTATVHRKQLVPDGQGGWKNELAPLHDIRWRMRPWTTEEQLLARQAGVRIGWVGYTDPDADVKRGDVVKSRGIMVDVVSTRQPSVQGHHLRVDCDERQT